MKMVEIKLCELFDDEPCPMWFASQERLLIPDRSWETDPTKNEFELGLLVELKIFISMNSGALAVWTWLHDDL